MKFQSTLLVIAIATTGVTSSGHGPHQKPRGLKSGKSQTIVDDADEVDEVDAVEEVVAVGKSSKAAETGDIPGIGKAGKNSKESYTTKGPKSSKFDNFKAGKDAKSSKTPKGTKTPKASEGLESAKEVRESFSAVPITKKKTKSSKVATPDTTSGCPFEDASASVSVSVSVSKSKGKRRALKGAGTMPTTACPATSKAAKSAKGATVASTAAPLPLDNAWGQAVGTQVVISPLGNPTYCVQAKAIDVGQPLEIVPCTYDIDDAFTIGEYGQLHTSDLTLCVTGSGNDLFLDFCATSCSAIFEYDPVDFTISPVFVDTCLFWTTVSGDLFLLEEMAADVTARRETVEDTQQFLVIPYFLGSGAPTSTAGPSSSLAPV